MNNPASPSEDSLAGMSREELLSALFANMVVQQTNMAMMLLGKVPHPETGQMVQDLDTAKMFIDQLEMLETKTKGNLNRQEDGLLKQALAALHLAFVEAVDAPAGGAPRVESGHDAAPAASPEPEAAKPAAAAPAETPAPPDESRKKFSKKY
jgi:Domain of unknown function (DUF1844)